MPTSEKRMERITASFSVSEFGELVKFSIQEDRSIGGMLRLMAIRYMASVSALVADHGNDIRSESMHRPAAGCDTLHQRVEG